MQGSANRGMIGLKIGDFGEVTGDALTAPPFTSTASVSLKGLGARADWSLSGEPGVVGIWWSS